PKVTPSILAVSQKLELAHSTQLTFRKPLVTSSTHRLGLAICFVNFLE
ncbi:MAG: hypothetical protein ACI82A_003187, partial [Candidatus Azotimanducaceae bacterium]